MWDVETGQQLGKFRHNSSDIYQNILFSKNNKTLVTRNSDSSVILWDIETRQPLGEPLDNSFSVKSIRFNPDGNLLMLSKDSLVLWEINQEFLLKKACAIVNRNFTQKEWQKYMGNRPYEKTCPNLPKDTIGAIELIRESNRLIKYNKIEEAKSKIKKAHALDPNLHTGKIELIKTFIQKGEMLAQQGKIKQAIENYTEAKNFDYNQNISSASWNILCWLGNLYGYFNEVKEACEKAVKLEPENRWNRRARGLNKALIGDSQGAIIDFKFFVDATKNNNLKLPKQLIKAQPKKDNPFTMQLFTIQLQEQRWLEILQQGKNPFTPEEIEKLKKRKF